MLINDIKQTDLTPSELEVLKHDTERWKKMGAGAHLDDWLAYGPGEMIRRRLAMRIATVNRPEGRGYAEALKQLRRSDGLDHVNPGDLGAVLWLSDHPERVLALRDLRAAMSPGQRSRLNSPITAAQRVRKILKAREEDTEAQVKLSPVALLKEQLAERDREIAELKQQLAKHDDGSLFDLRKSTPDEIAAVITDVTNISTSKAKAIAKAIDERLKRKQQKPAG
jgi:hypothetical protein